MRSSNSQSHSQKSYGSPCAACKCLRRRCLPDCIFAPYFPADQPQKFEVIHATYGASNVSKLLNHLSYDDREIAVKSLVYEAEARQKDPVHGCVAFISILQRRLQELDAEFSIALQELAPYIVPEPNNVNVPTWPGESSTQRSTNVNAPTWPGESSTQRSTMEGQSSSQQFDGFGTYYGIDTGRPRANQQPATAEQLLPATKQQQPSQDHMRREY